MCDSEGLGATSSGGVVGPSESSVASPSAEGFTSAGSLVRIGRDVIVSEVERSIEEAIWATVESL